jgi:hypothetical protein
MLARFISFVGRVHQLHSESARLNRKEFGDAKKRVVIVMPLLVEEQMMMIGQKRAMKS